MNPNPYKKKVQEPEGEDHGAKMDHAIALTTEDKGQSHGFVPRTVAAPGRPKQGSHMSSFIILEDDFEISWQKMADSRSPQECGRRELLL